MKSGTTYLATFAMNDASGVVLNRRITIRGTLVATQPSQTSTCIPSHH